MTPEEIEELLSRQEFDTALREAEAVLASDPANADILFLKGKCLFELANSSQQEEDARWYAEKAYEAFGAVAAAGEGYTDALEYKTYMGAYNRYIENRETETLADCNQLINRGDTMASMRYLQWRYQIHIRLNQPDAAIEDMNQLLAVAGTLFADNLPRYNEMASNAYFYTGEVFQLDKQDNEQALVYYKKAFNHVMYHGRYLPVARLALACKDYDFTNAIFDALFVSLAEMSDEMIQLLEAVRDEYQHTQCLPVAYMYCRCTAAFADIMLGGDEEEVTIEQISLGKQLAQQYPEETYFWNYIARALFRAEQYEQALPYLEKCLSLDPGPLAIVRWCYIQYKLNGRFPDSWPDIVHDFPYNWYEAGVICSELEVDAAASRQHQELLKYLYGKAIALYKNYWFNHTGTAKSHNAHHFAMCCNNYANALYSLGEYEASVEIHTVGYEMSPFWEQLDARAYSYEKLGQYDKAVADREAVLTQYAYAMNYLYYVSNFDLLIYAYSSELHNNEKALYWYNLFMTEYNNWLAAEIAQLSQEEQDQLQRHINDIKTMRGLIEAAPGDLPQRIGILEEHLVQHPDDSDAYFNLMQLYYQNGQYELCAGCATNRLSIGGMDHIPLISQVKVYYFRGMASIRLERYQQALDDMRTCEMLLQQPPADKGTAVDYFKIYGYLGMASLGMGHYDDAIAYSQKSIAVNTEQNWAWDEYTADVYYTLACAWKEKGNTRSAKRVLDEILEEIPGYEKAIQKLAEW